MEKKPLSLAQVNAISKIEVFIIMQFDQNPEVLFKEILKLIDEYKISEDQETMEYLHGLLVHRGYLEYSAELAKKYNIKNENT